MEKLKNYLQEKKEEAAQYLNDDLKDLADELSGYDNSYICDAITEISDNKIDIDYSDLRKWLKEEGEAIYYCEEAVKNYLIDWHDFDFYKMIQCGQFAFYEALFYNNLEEIIKVAVIIAMVDNLDNIEDIELLDYEDIDNILVNIDYSDNNAIFGDLWMDAINEAIEEKKEA